GQGGGPSGDIRLPDDTWPRTAPRQREHAPERRGSGRPGPESPPQGSLAGESKPKSFGMNGLDRVLSGGDLLDGGVDQVPVDGRAEAGAGGGVHVAVGVDRERLGEAVAEVGEAVIARAVEREDFEPVAVVDGHHDVP